MSDLSGGCNTSWSSILWRDSPLWFLGSFFFPDILDLHSTTSIPTFAKPKFSILNLLHFRLDGNLSTPTNFMQRTYSIMQNPRGAMLSILYHYRSITPNENYVRHINVLVIMGNYLAMSKKKKKIKLGITLKFYCQVYTSCQNSHVCKRMSARMFTAALFIMAKN